MHGHSPPLFFQAVADDTLKHSGHTISSCFDFDISTFRLFCLNVAAGLARRGCYLHEMECFNLHSGISFASHTPTDF
jgi:hypothetical protein